MTLNIASLHPQVAQELKAAKELYKKQNLKLLPPLLQTDQFPPLPSTPKIATPTNQQQEEKSENEKKYEMPNKFVIAFSDLQMTTDLVHYYID